MKIRRLRLQNYRRYHEQELEFADGVTAVVGRNGAGKSTLLEAIGFALFGTAAVRTGKDLLRWDQAPPGDAVAVEVDLELGDQAIRVRRELRGKNLTPSATMEADGVLLVPPGAGSARAVTEQVERHLGMSQAAFFNTVVARQKELSLLSDQDPAARKRLILNMLGVDALDRAIQEARGNRRRCEDRAQVLAAELLDDRGLQVATQEAQSGVESAKKRLADLEEAWVAAQARLESCRKRSDQEEVAAKKRHTLQSAADDAARRVEDAKRSLSKAEEALQAAMVAAKQVERLGPTQEKRDAARKALGAAEELHRARRERDRLAAQAERHRERIGSTREALAGLQIPEDPTDELARLVKEAELAKESLGARERDVAVAEERHRKLRNELRRIAGLGEDAPCPTCQQPLADHLPALRDRLTEEEDAAHAALDMAKQARQQAQADLQNVTRALESLQEAGRRREQSLLRQRELQQTVQEEEAALAELDLPEAPDPLPDLRPLQAALREAERSHEERLRLHAAAASLPERKADVEAEQARVRDAEGAFTQANEALAGVPDNAEALQQAKAALEAAQGDERQAEREIHTARVRLERAEHAVSRAQAKRQEQAERRKRLQVHREEARYWTALAGQRGGGVLDNFKTHLVERIGPAIAAEASRLLSEFTDGRYTELLLDEEYRIYVTDGATRYDLDRFSGGESDLAHLALRLAVSRLLAERSGGAELRFLALDEVFGSLDSQRQGSVLAALRKLSNLYSQILTITHIQELRDGLDHAMEVTDVDGSPQILVHAR